ncbi:MAG: phosphoribosylformylglycinamidine synthase subunit PurL [Bacteroidota bacterium]|nr:phosphoribosylformylglycinamidine synthase subunit PurL [Candidatus Kapabacteria bacterium]MDW8218954.1 phosphoribosylformylglycinamidine synthase subunit PurL [Bacteroidota bacterium]
MNILPHLYSEIIVTHETARELGLHDHEFDAIMKILGRLPTYTELGMYSVMWSEHCSYKNSILELKKLPRSGGRMLVEAGQENAGLIDIGYHNGKRWALAFKIESHNHPSAIEPVQGAATGVGGILRDIFTMGARPIAALNSLRFGHLDGECAARTRYLVNGVVHGISHYGNAFGVPTVGGEVYFDECYTENPLVNAMAVGIVEVGKTASAVASGVGNPVFILGSRTGRDGIHGASMASKEFEESPEDMRPTVQVGDPFAEKMLLEASLELIAEGVVVGMQDMGAAGICCSTSEMSAKAGTGMVINLDLVPLREEGMSAYEILLSESQERMLVVVQRGHEERARRICEKWDVPITQIGEVTGDGVVRIFHNDKQVAEVPAQSLVLGGGAPVYVREWKEAAYISETRKEDFRALQDVRPTEEAFWKILSSPTIASKRWIYEQYDAEVGTNTILRASADAAVLRIKELPGKAIAVTTDCNSRYVYLNPYMGGMIAVAEAGRNVACTGAEPVAVTNCLNFGNPYNPEVYWQFREALRGMGDACRALNTPVTGGNVSFHNESRAAARTGGKPRTIFPTPTIGMVGLIDDVSTVTGNGFTNAGDAVVLLFIQNDLPNLGLGGSEYVKQIHGYITGDAPFLDIEAEKRLQALVITAIRQRLVHAVHDISEGGLAVALAEMAINSYGNLGVTIDMQSTPTVPMMFGEIQSRILVALPHTNIPMLERLSAAYEVSVQHIGTVVEDVFKIVGYMETSIYRLRSVYESALPALLQ